MSTPEKSQRERFEEAARELGCEEDEAKFNANLKKIASAKSEKSGEPNEDG